MAGDLTLHFERSGAAENTYAVLRWTPADPTNLPPDLEGRARLVFITDPAHGVIDLSGRYGLEAVAGFQNRGRPPACRDCCFYRAAHRRYEWGRCHRFPPAPPVHHADVPAGPAHTRSDSFCGEFCAVFS